LRKLSGCCELRVLEQQNSLTLDDSLIKDFDQQTLVSQTEMVIQLFLNLFFYILEEVGVDSFSEFSVSRGTLQNRPGSHFPSRGKNCFPLSENSVVPTLSVRNSQTVFSTARFPIGFHSEMGYQEKRIQDKRSITGLIPPVFLGTKKRRE
jgi:hypothetical protein